MDRNAKKKKRFGLILRLGFLFLSVLLLIHIVDFKLVLDHIQNIPSSTLGILVIIDLVRTWLTGVRWQMVNPDVSEQLSSWQYFKLVMMAKPFNLIMPGALGGDLVKTALTLKAVKAKRVENVIAIAVDRFVGLLSITILGLTSFALMSDLPDKDPFYGFFAALVLGFTAALVGGGNRWVLRQMEAVFVRLGCLGQRLIRVLDTWREALLFFGRNLHRLLLALLLCLPIHGLSFLSAYIIVMNLGMELSYFDISAVLALVWVITAVPITISGAGVRELSLIHFLALFGVQAEPATALSIYIYIVSLALGAIGLVFLLVPRPPKSEKQ